MVVVIDLQPGDDPQVIFETLNARGEPLLPADLLRNYIFLRATRSEGNPEIEKLYQQYWSRFDDEFWRQEVTQGRLTRPRSDLYMQHFLASQQGQDIPIKHLYIEYRHWLEREKPFKTVTEELAALAKQGDYFRRILAPQADDPIKSLASFLDVYDVRTAYPLLLTLFELNISNEDWMRASSILESYLLRRAVCNLGTKNYNRVFLALAKNIRREGFSVERLQELLSALFGESAGWPDDAKFTESWLHRPVYGILNSPKLVHLYIRLNSTFMSSKKETISFEEAPTIEHIMPQRWEENWLLPDGSVGLNWMELVDAKPDDPRAIATRRREAAIQTLGNLTILSSGLNTAQSNAAWDSKRPEMMKHSLLPINQDLWGIKTWDEAAILSRGERLLKQALSIWPSPKVPSRPNVGTTDVK
jgi:hypothetical protein